MPETLTRMNTSLIKITSTSDNPGSYNYEARKWGIEQQEENPGHLFGIIEPPIVDDVTQLVRAVNRNRHLFRSVSVPGYPTDSELFEQLMTQNPSELYVEELIEISRKAGVINLQANGFHLEDYGLCSEQSFHFQRAEHAGRIYNDDTDSFFLAQVYLTGVVPEYTVIHKGGDIVKKRRLKIHGIARFPYFPDANITLVDKPRIIVTYASTDPEIYNQNAEIWGFHSLMPTEGQRYGVIDPPIAFEAREIIETVVRNRDKFRVVHVPETQEKRKSRLDFRKYVLNNTPSTGYIEWLIGEAEELGALDVDFVPLAILHNYDDPNDGINVYGEQSLYFRRAEDYNGRPYANNPKLLFLGRMFLGSGAARYYTVTDQRNRRVTTELVHGVARHPLR